MNGCSRSHLQAYLYEFCWRYNLVHDERIFNRILQVINDHFPLGVSRKISWCDKYYIIDDQDDIYFHEIEDEKEDKGEDQEEGQEDGEEEDEEISEDEIEGLMRDLEKTFITEPEPEPARPNREDRRLLRDVKRQAINQQQLEELRVFRERLAQVDAMLPRIQCDRCDTSVSNYRGNQFIID